MEGDKFEATFQISGNPSPEVFFYKDEEPLEDSPRAEITNKGNSWTLAIADLKEDDSGIYVVEAENDNGLIEREFEIDVARKLLIFAMLRRLAKTHNTLFGRQF